MSPIDDKYASLVSLLGNPSSSEEPVPGGGRARKYERGVIYWHPQTGAHEIHGEILAKWQSLGSSDGELGFPRTDELQAGGNARFNNFVNGSIYWRPGVGACVIPPQIFDKWQTMQWENGIGFPLADPIDTIGGEIRQRFEKAVLVWRPQLGVSVIHQPAPFKKTVRVFLVNWADVVPPAAFTREFFDRFFFGAGESMTNPAGGMVPMSVSDYFSSVSDGNMQLSGAVMPWISNPLHFSDVVHVGNLPWPRPGSPGTLGAIVGQTLRTAGIRNTEQLKIGGTVPDALVFIALDVIAGGGATRNMGSVKTELQQAGRMDIWDSNWDAFLGMPVCMVSFTRQVPDPAANPDSTYPAPPAGSLHWVSQSALHHELVHALLGFGADIYWGNYVFDTWFEIMSFTVGTDWPIPMSTYLRERCGFSTILDLPRQTHLGQVLDPLESHNTAVRFQNGPIHAPESIVLENRRRYDYRQNPPIPQSNIIFAYTIDPKSRCVQPSGNPLTGRVIKRNVEWGDTWGTTPGLDLTGDGQDLANTLNYAGEHWWDFRNIQVIPGGDQIRLDALYKPQDLVSRYRSASWTNGRGQILNPNVAQGVKGQVLMVGRSAPIVRGLRYDSVLSVHPDGNAGGAVTGVYRVAVPPEGARLYVTAALSQTALGSAGVQFSIRVNGSPIAQSAVTLARGVRTFAVDLFSVRNTTAEISISALAGATPTRDSAYILEAVVVPTAPVLIDLFARATAATWRTNTGNIPFNGSIGPQGHALFAAATPLQNGVIYGPSLLYTHPAWRNDGFVEGLFPVTLPASPAIFRAELGFPESRATTDNGALFSVRFVDTGGTSTPILMNGPLIRNPAMGDKGVENNHVMTAAAILPASIQGAIGNLVLRVDAAGSATEDQVHWTMARITSA